jgi:hypothetical protein
MLFPRPAARRRLALPIPSHRHRGSTALNASSGGSSDQSAKHAAGHTFAISRPQGPESCQGVLPRFTLETGGCRAIPRRDAGNAGMRAAPAVSCANVRKEKRTRAYRFSGGIRHSLRNGLTAYATLSSATNSSCHRRRRIEVAARPGRVRGRYRRLGTSNGCRDHMVLPYAQTPFVLRACDRSRGSTRPAITLACRRSRVHRILSHVRDDARPPLLPEQDGPR